MCSASRSHTDHYFKVLRYSALLFGIFYGFTHQRSLNSHAAAAKVQAEYKHKEDLIQKAKMEWKKKNMPSESKTSGGDGKFPDALRLTTLC